jgi:3-methyl-2-oxobutanoate hydroxymethyltransferase
MSLNRKPMTLHRLREMHASGEKIAMLTCYDACFAAVLDGAGVDALLVGDSLGMVLQGRSNTLAVSMEAMEYHVRCVAGANRTAWLLADLPFGSYVSPEAALNNAVRLMQAGAQMVKLEGGGWTAPIVERMVERGIPICAHLGFTPQSVHALGGYRVQGRDESAAATLRQQALELVQAGAAMVLFEMVPAALAAGLARELTVPTIGIGAGVGCGGQVLVLHDMLGLHPTGAPRFVRNFLTGGRDIPSAIREYVAAVKSGQFPDDAVHAF